METIALFVGIAIGVWGFCYYEIKTWPLLKLTIKSGRNSNRRAREMFIELLNQAQEEMLLYDDGSKGGMYDDEDVVAAVGRRLAENPGFRMLCLFTYKEQTAFRTAFGNHDRVKIRERAERSEIHYRIIDRGRQGYLSRHKLGAGEERPFRFYDCSKASPREQEALIARTLGRYVTETRQAFAHAS